MYEINLINTKILIYCSDANIIQGIMRFSEQPFFKRTVKCDRIIYLLILGTGNSIVSELITRNNLSDRIPIVKDIKLTQCEFYSSLNLLEFKNQNYHIFLTTSLKWQGSQIVKLLYYIVSITSLKHKEMIIHGCGVESRGIGCLFLGNSNAGKSTLAKLSIVANKAVLSDDIVTLSIQKQIKLIPSPGSMNTIFDLKFSTPTLFAIFDIKKSSNNFISPKHTKAKISKILFHSFLSLPWSSYYSEKQLISAFHCCNSISHNVNGYELCFTKSPDFWDLIDAEFGD